MSRYTFLSILIFSLVFAGLAALNPVLLALALPAAIYLTAGLWFGPGELDLEITREVSQERAAQNSPVVIRLLVKNRGGHLEQICIEDTVPAGLEPVEGEAGLLTQLPAGSAVELCYTVKGKRGLYHFPEVRAIASDRLGIVTRQKTFPTPGRIFILPQVLRLKQVAIRPRQTRVYSGSIPARQGGPGIEFFGVRGYQEGDPLRHVNWRISARHDERLFTNEFQQERVADIGLILDARLRSSCQTPQGSLFEYAVTAAAALAQTLLNDGNRVGLLVYGAYLNWTYPGYGKIQRERIMQALARAQTGSSMVFEKLENLPTRIFPAKSQVILISSLVNDDLPVLTRMRARGYQVLVISPDPVSYEAGLLDSSTGDGAKGNANLPHAQAVEIGKTLAGLERSLLINRLRQAGVQVANWDVAVPFDQAMTILTRPLPAAFQPFGGRL